MSKDSGQAGHEIERDAIQLAIDTLQDIQKTKLGYPPWEQYFQKEQVGLLVPRRANGR
jgi:hypothetical protein